jgi:hypothetical protein
VNEPGHALPSARVAADHAGLCLPLAPEPDGRGLDEHALGVQVPSGGPQELAVMRPGIPRQFAGLARIALSTGVEELHHR